MRKLTFKLFSVFVSFANFFGNVAYSYDPKALDLTLNNARNNEDVRIVFIKKIPELNNSVATGFHSVQKYCWLIGCEKKDLEKLLKGKIIGKGFVNSVMVKDFMNLANKVKKELEEEKEKYENSVPCSACYKYLSKKGSKLCWACNKKFGKKFK